MSDTPPATATPYTIRESPRARRVILRVSPRRGVEVVVPVGFDAGAVPGIVAQRREWIERHVARLRARGWTGGRPVRPEVLALRCLGREVRLKVAPNAAKAPALREVGPDALLLSGDVDDEGACRGLVLGWLKNAARVWLVPLLRELAREQGLGFERAQVRAQAARWGSCSARGTISLNCKVLFLPPELARHVLLHELAHTVHLNHSKDFWALLRRMDPDTARKDARLDDAWSLVPDWLG